MAVCASLPSFCSSSSFGYGYTYDVFISFRGKDARYSFTGNLFNALKEKGIHTFFDDRELQGGEEITPTLVKAIKESRIAIPVISENYASSSFCLDELAMIIECVKAKGRLVLPIFYEVDPSHVRHQIGSYKEAMAKHEERFKYEIVQKWREALNQVANLSGKHFIFGYPTSYFVSLIIILDKLIYCLSKSFNCSRLICCLSS